MVSWQLSPHRNVPGQAHARRDLESTTRRAYFSPSPMPARLQYVEDSVPVMA